MRIAVMFPLMFAQVNIAVIILNRRRVMAASVLRETVLEPNRKSSKGS